MIGILENITTVTKLRLVYGAFAIAFFCVGKTSLSGVITAGSGYVEVERDIRRLSTELAGTVAAEDAGSLRQFSNEPLLTTVSRFCGAHDIRINEMTQTQANEVSGFQILTAKVRLQGGFYAVLKLLHNIENNRSAAVQSVSWKMIKGVQGEETTLNAILYLKYAQHEKTS